MVDVSEVLRELRQHYKLPDEGGAIGCLKLNIEGGEYEVLEALINRGEIGSFRCLLIQFHRQPVGFLRRHRRSPKASALPKPAAGHFRWCGSVRICGMYESRRVGKS
jgi:hypothetical protein